MVTRELSRIKIPRWAGVQAGTRYEGTAHLPYVCAARQALIAQITAINYNFRGAPFPLPCHPASFITSNSLISPHFAPFLLPPIFLTTVFTLPVPAIHLHLTPIITLRILIFIVCLHFFSVTASPFSSSLSCTSDLHLAPCIALYISLCCNPTTFPFLSPSTAHTRKPYHLPRLLPHPFMFTPKPLPPSTL